MKILVASDFQVGAGRTLGLTLAEHERYLHQLVDLAEDADLFLFCGDAFESRSTNRDQDEVFMRLLVEIARRCQVHVVGGNHDWRGYEKASTVGIFREMGVTVALEPGVHRYGDVALASLPWASLGHLVAAQDGEDRMLVHERAAQHLVTIAAGLREQCRGQTAILAAHWAVTGASLPTGLPVDQLHEPVIEIADLAAQRWDSIALGHVHRAQTIECDVPAFYCGSAVACNWGEAGFEHGAWILEPDPSTRSEHEKALYVPRFVPIESRRLVTVDAEATDLVIEGRTALAPVDGIQDAIVRLRIRATQEQARTLDVAQVKRDLIDNGAYKIASVQLDVERAERARVEGFEEDLSEIEALVLWCRANDVTGAREQELIARTQRYMQDADTHRSATRLDASHLGAPRLAASPRTVHRR